MSFSFFWKRLLNLNFLFTDRKSFSTEKWKSMLEKILKPERKHSQGTGSRKGKEQSWWVGDAKRIPCHQRRYHADYDPRMTKKNVTLNGRICSNILY